jgi:hypothetical protein
MLIRLLEQHLLALGASVLFLENLVVNQPTFLRLALLMALVYLLGVSVPLASAKTSFQAWEVVMVGASAVMLQQLLDTTS